MAADDSVEMYSPDAAHTSVSVDDGRGPVTYSSDATGKIAHVEPRHTAALTAHGLLRERPKKASGG